MTNIVFRNDFKLYWPTWDTKSPQNYHYIQKHLCSMDFALKRLKKREVCIQAGGHVGIWPLILASMFDRLYTFEPDPDLFECLQLNTESERVLAYNQALSTKTGDIVPFKRTGSSGSGCISNDGTFKIDTQSIDDLNLDSCDIIFLDIEGYEFEALSGAIETIKKYKPIVQVEELTENLFTDDLMKKLGYTKHPEKQKKDRVYLP